MNYKKYAGLFDFIFTEQDFKIIVIILFTWLVRMYIQRKSQIDKSPSLDDYISTLTIQYLVAGLIYEIVIHFDITLAMFILPIAFISIFSYDFIMYISKDEKSKTKLFKSLTDVIVNKINWFLNLLK